MESFNETTNNAIIAKNRRKMNKCALEIFYVIVSTCIVMLGLLLLEFSERNWYTYFSILVVTSILLQYFTLRKYVELFSITSLFLILTYGFHFGIIINKGIFIFYTPEYDLFSEYELDFATIKSTAVYCLLSILALGFGILLGAKRKKRLSKETQPKLSRNVFKFGMMLIIIGLPFLIGNTYKSINAYLKGSYLETFDEIGDGSGVKAFLSNLFYCGIASLMVYYSRFNRKKVKFLWLCVAAFIIVTMMFTGGRGAKLLMLVVLTMIAYYCRLFKITKFKIIFYLLIGYFGIVMLNTIADIRGETLDFMPVFINNLGGTALLDLLQEMGGSIYTPYLCIAQAGKVYNRAYGFTYLLSFITVLPNIGGAFSNSINQASFVKSLIGSALGGSFIGESYFNFGWFGFLFVILIGVFVSKISDLLSNGVRDGKVMIVALLVPISAQILWWSRDSFLGFARPFVWGTVICVLLWRISKIRCYKKTFGLSI